MSPFASFARLPQRQIPAAILLAVLMAAAQPAFSQRPGGFDGSRGASQSEGAPTTSSGISSISSGRSATSINGPGTAPGAAPLGSGIGIITDPGFPAGLGATVGGSYPGVALPAGVNNINHPGMQPLPTTVQPGPAGTIGGTGGAHMPPRWDPTWNGRGDGRKHGRGDGKGDGRFPGRVDDGKRGPGGRIHGPVVYYSIPYYVPYTTIYTVEATASSVQPAPPAGTAPYGSGYTSVQPGQQAPAPSAEASPDSGARPLTVLVFKDRTVVMVRDYWLEGDRFWYVTPEGVRASLFMEQVDLPFTQQLNRERGVRFVLESRP